MKRVAAVLLTLVVCQAPAMRSVAMGVARNAGLQPTDLTNLRSVGDVHFSPDAAHIAYSIISGDRPGRPYSQLWILTVATKQSSRLGSPDGVAWSPRWSPDGRSIAYFGTAPRAGLFVAAADGSGARFVAPVSGTNHPLPASGESIAWSPDGRQVAFVSSTPGPEQDANGDPMIITRYLYKPTASEGLTRFNDNRRLHIFVADLASAAVRQITSGTFYEHSIDWAPSADRILFVSNRESDPDRFFNYDIFTVRPSDGSITRLTNTKNAEYEPVWSPDGARIAYLGTTRELTSSETTMEDTHVWVMNADGTSRVEAGGAVDNRQGPARWSADGRSLYFSVQERGDTHLYRIACGAGGARCPADRVVSGRGSLGDWSLAERGATAHIAYAFGTPQGPAELYLSSGGTAAPVTTLNKDLLSQRTIAEVDSFTFKSFDGTEIEAFLTKPIDIASSPKHPLIVIMHGGPHGAQGAAFNAKAQIYATRGWASLMVNYRGSTGYGQKLADAIFGDQNGGEAKDVLAGVDAALARFPWLDGDRMGLEGVSYGGQLANWIVTRTDRFKAAIPISGISNLITQNYLSYYHDYLAVEFGGFPHEKGINDKLWERSAIRYVDKVKTPTMLVHGENDNDVPIAEAEQFYIALKDVGVDTIMIRYPREGHGVREVGHTIDLIDRSIAWYEKYFAAAGRSSAEK
jgi:dipeptidyl aminopeptidase/acylaminoacyl peptidase